MPMTSPPSALHFYYSRSALRRSLSLTLDTSKPTFSSLVRSFSSKQSAPEEKLTGSAKKSTPKENDTNSNANANMQESMKSVATDETAPPISETITISTKSTTSSSLSSKLPSWVSQGLNIWQEQSGTAEVLHLKQQVSLSSMAFDEASMNVTNARRSLEEKLLDWERVSGQHLQLLQRKESWSPQDAQQFAALVSQEVSCKTALEDARKALQQAENALSESQLDYMNAMRQRYHEEQVWQDQWRVLSTYGTWGLILLNSCVFMASQFFHYRREAQKRKDLQEWIHTQLVNMEEKVISYQQEQVQPQAKEKELDPKHHSSVVSHMVEMPKQEEEALYESKGHGLLYKSEGDSASGGAPDPNVPLNESGKNHSNSATRSPAWQDEDYVPVMEWLSWAKHKTQTWLVDKLPTAPQVLQEMGENLTASVTKHTHALTEDVHVPSAAFGATVTGITFASIWVLSSLFSR